MNIVFDFGAILQSLVLLAVIWGGVHVRGVRMELHKQNGRIGKIEQWKEDHDKVDDQKWRENQDTHIRLFTRIDALK